MAGHLAVASQSFGLGSKFCYYDWLKIAK